MISAPRRRTRLALIAIAGLMFLTVATIDLAAVYRHCAYTPAAEVTVSPQGVVITACDDRRSPGARLEMKVSQLTIDGVRLDSATASAESSYALHRLRWPWLPGRNVVMVPRE